MYVIIRRTKCLRVSLDHLLPGGNKYTNLACQVGETSNLREQYLVTNPSEIGSEKDCAGEAQQQL
jgi:hypothetical protein